MDNITDVLIIGGGYAGLAAASTLYRATHSVIVFDSNEFRDDRAPKVRLLPTWEGKTSGSYRETVRADLANTGLCSFVQQPIESVEKTTDGLWEVGSKGGDRWLGRKVILATGSEEIYPDISGYEDCWVTGIFPCLFQFGYEERGCSSAGILVVEKLAAHLPQVVKLASDANKFAKKVVLYTNGNESATSSLQSLTKDTDYVVDGRHIKSLVKGPNRAEVSVEFEDGESKLEGFLVHQPYTKLRGPLPKQLSLETTPFGDIKVEHPFPATSVAGVYAAGDCASPFKNASMAIAAGVCAGNGVSRELPSPLLRSMA